MNPPPYSLHPLRQDETTQNDRNVNLYAPTPSTIHEPQHSMHYTSPSPDKIFHTDPNANLQLYAAHPGSPLHGLQNDMDYPSPSEKYTHQAGSPLHEPQNGMDYPSLSQQHIHQTDPNPNLHFYAAQPASPLHESQSSMDYPSLSQQQIPRHSVHLTDIPTHYGPKSQSVVCPHCKLQILTRVKVEPSQRTHLYTIILCIFLFPFSWLPYCTTYCQNKSHYCPNCGAYLATSFH